MRSTMRRLAPLARSLHTSPRPLAPAAAARRVPTPVKAAASSSDDPFADIDIDPSPRATSTPKFAPRSAPRSIDSAADVQVMPPLSQMPNESYEPLPDARRIPGEARQSWGDSLDGMAAEPFPKEVAEALMKPLAPDMIEVKPGGFTACLHSHVAAQFLPLRISFHTSVGSGADSLCRWYSIHARNQIPSYSESGVRTRRLGSRTAR